jgi:hypothetical protein
MSWKSAAYTFYQRVLGIPQFKEAAKTLRFAEYRALREAEAQRLPGDIALEGYKVYSQNDEDGLIDAIFARLGGGRSFLEIGVEDGRECNTHLLLLKGWRGGWIDGNDKSCKKIISELGGQQFRNVFNLQNKYIYPDNIVETYKKHCDFLEVAELDFFSLDVDGNDAFIIESLLSSGARPIVCCVEYNGKFPPGLNISVNFDNKRGWSRDDYFGASLDRFDQIFESHGYQLITCNITGANAFYVLKDKSDIFVQRSPKEVWRQLRLDLSPLPAGHVPTLKFLRDFLNRQ